MIQVAIAAILHFIQVYHRVPTPSSKDVQTVLIFLKNLTAIQCESTDLQQLVIDALQSTDESCQIDDQIVEQTLSKVLLNSEDQQVLLLVDAATSILQPFSDNKSLIEYHLRQDTCYYRTYIKVEELSSLCEPRSSVFEEKLFIRVHQAIEVIWSQAIDTLITIFGQKSLCAGNKIIALLNQTAALIKAGIDILSCLYEMPVDEFHEFRRNLDTASGRQSKQFYILKALLGFQVEDGMPFIDAFDNQKISEYKKHTNLYSYMMQLRAELSDELYNNSGDMDLKQINKSAVQIVINWKNFQAQHISVVSHFLQKQQQGTNKTSGIKYLQEELKEGDRWDTFIQQVEGAPSLLQSTRNVESHFRLGQPLICSRELIFDQQEGQFTAFCDELPESSSYGYESCLVKKINFCAHLHSTHIETQKHIKTGPQDTRQAAKQTFEEFLALCLEIKTQQNQQIELPLIQAAVDEALQSANSLSQQYQIRGIILALSWEGDKEIKQSGFPYLSTESVKYLKHSLGIEIYMTSAASFDAETSSTLDNHRTIFSGPQDSFIVEFVECSQLHTGFYVVDLGVYPTDQDSFPVVVKARRILNQ